MSVVKFIENEYAGGSYDYPTPCPHGCGNPYTEKTYGAGGFGCQRCCYYGGRIDDEHLRCNYVSILQKKKHKENIFKEAR